MISTTWSLIVSTISAIINALGSMSVSSGVTFLFLIIFDAILWVLFTTLKKV